jgi:hypothetical protein
MVSGARFDGFSTAKISLAGALGSCSQMLAHHKQMNGNVLDFEKMKQFMEFFYAEKFCSTTHAWRMSGS